MSHTGTSPTIAGAPALQPLQPVLDTALLAARQLQALTVQLHFCADLQPDCIVIRPEISCEASPHWPAALPSSLPAHLCAWTSCAMNRSHRHRRAAAVCCMRFSFRSRAMACSTGGREHTPRSTAEQVRQEGCLWRAAVGALWKQGTTEADTGTRCCGQELALRLLLVCTAICATNLGLQTSPGAPPYPSASRALPSAANVTSNYR